MRPVPYVGASPASRGTRQGRIRRASLAAIGLAALVAGAWAALPGSSERATAVVTLPPAEPAATTPQPTPETGAAALPPALPERAPSDTAPAPRPVRPEPRSATPEPVDDFAIALGEAIAAADRRAWDEAESTLGRAAAARPGTAEVAEVAARIAEGRRSEQISHLQKAAADAAAAEDWHAEALACEKALALDPTLTFAQIGLARARERAQLVDSIERHLARPDRLTSEPVALEAERALSRARDSSPGARLTQRMAALEQALAAARVTYPVRLVSDGQTEVTVLRVGSQGRVTDKQLQLRAGTWSVVGTRKGYRDVRLQVVVAAGRETPPVVVRCVDPL